MAIASDARAESSHLGKTFHFKGEISGTEDIFIDGEVEGSIQLNGQAVTVGPHGQVKANIQARDLLVQGKVTGNVQAQDRVEITRTGGVWGDMSMARISVQDGGFIQGRVDIRTGEKREAAPNPAPVAAVGASAGPAQGSLLGSKI